jgi:replicative DNA helicase
MSLQLPHPPEAEHELAAAVFVDHGVLEQVSDLVSADDFYNGILRIVWESLNEVVKRDGSLDLPLFREYLRDHGLWERVGGDDTIVRLLNRGGTTRNAPLYAREVRSFARRRSVIAAAEDIAITGKGAVDDVQEYCLDAEAKIRDAASGRAVHRFITPAEAVASVYKIATEAPGVDDTTRGIPTGLHSLDTAYTHGGLPRGMIVIAGRPKMGKTNMGLQLGLNMALCGQPGVIFSLEMTSDQVTARSLAYLAGIDSRRIMGKEPLVGPELDRFLAAGEDLAALPYLIDDETGITASQIRARCGRAKREMGGRLDWCVIDFFTLMGHPDNGRRRDDAMSTSSKALAKLAKDMGMCVILLSQLNRKCEEKTDRRPEMQHLRECGALEEDAAMVMFPFWPWHYGSEPHNVPMYRNAPKDEAELMIGANRFGATGCIKLSFDPEYHRYRERDALYG